MIKFIMLCLFCFCNSSDSETDGSIESEESELSVEDLEEVMYESHFVICLRELMGKQMCFIMYSVPPP